MDKEKLQLWQERYERNKNEWADEADKMDPREELYRGKARYKAFVNGDACAGKDVEYSYNIVAETIEAQVSSDIPQPKVTARRKQDEHLAEIIENMLRNELDRLPMETINDIAERTVPIQGGGFYLVEWDNSKRTHTTVGENSVSFLNPKWVVPQAGVFTGPEDMDYLFLRIPTTKESIWQRYGVDVSEEAESELDLKAVDDEPAQDMVTQIICYYRNDRGGIGMYSWVNDTELVDLEDYQARHLRRCAECGEAEPADGTVLGDGDEEPGEWHSGDPCPTCGGTKWSDSEEDWLEVTGPIIRSDGTEVEGTGEVLGYIEIPESGMTGELQGEKELKIPYYKPDCFPVVLQRNVSVFGQLLGESDVDKIESQQNGLNRLEKKIFDRFLKAGTKITLPTDPMCHIDPEDDEVIRITSASDKALIDAYNFTGNLEQELYQVNAIYQHARQAIGITDSYQGRSDSTAASGVAREFAAAQSAGRLQSKRTMKEAAYADMFKMMFQFRLAYADEDRPVVYQDAAGETVYDTFCKWDFLERDDNGDFYWNDQFLFSCDTSAPLAQNRERMWQETTSFLTAGAFGDPTNPETLVSYWRKMEMLHYPGAGETRKQMQEKLRQQQEQQAMMQAMQEQQAQQEQQQQATAESVSGIEAQAQRQALMDSIDRAAQQQAAKDFGMA